MAISSDEQCCTSSFAANCYYMGQGNARPMLNGGPATALLAHYQGHERPVRLLRRFRCVTCIQQATKNLAVLRDDPLVIVRTAPNGQKSKRAA